jgi:2-(1,2-epoxy-1,2-dihydrophenyl)acetyl-CoA isomerase
MFETPGHREYLVDLTNGVLRLSFNRPEFGNAMHQTAALGLAKLFRDAQQSQQVRSILIRGEGRNFSAGGDVAGFARSLEQDVPTRQADFARRLSNLRALVEAVHAFDRPLVVSVRGAAAGAGLFYPLAADYVIGDPTALLVFAHQSIGLCPDNGVSALLPQVVGQRMARSLLLTAARVKADEALRLGLIHRIVLPEELEAEAIEIACRMARAPRRATVLAKRLVNESSSRGLLSEQLDAEMNGIVACVGDDDFEEGVRAFLQKRKPNFPSAQ